MTRGGNDSGVSQPGEATQADLARMLDAMPVGVVLLDAELRVEIVNHAYRTMFGASEGEFPTGCQARDLLEAARRRGAYDVDDDEWEGYVAARLKAIARGDVEPREMQRANGLTLISSVVSLSGSKRLITYYDVTPLKRREAELAAALEKSRLAEAVMDSVPNPLFVKDAELRFVIANHSFARIFGVPPQAMIGRRASDFVGREAACFEASERHVLDTGEIFETEEDFELDGEPQTRIVRKNKLRTDGGRDYVVGTIFDVTELKRRETEARQTRRFLESVLESLPAGVVIYDAEDRFVLANGLVHEALPAMVPTMQPGVPLRRAIEAAHDAGYFRDSGDPALDAIYDRDREAWIAGYLERYGAAFRVFERRNPDGRWFKAIDTRAEDGSYVGVRVDISELKARETELYDANRKAVLADRAKSEFLANMSHEIRTPMNGVLGMAELLAKSELDAKQKTFTDIIMKSGTALLTIINDILDFSKIDAGQMVLDPAPFDLAEAIEDVATLMSTRAKEKDLEVIVRIETGLPKRFVGDVGRIRQIVTNLVGNAVKFTDAGHVLVDVRGQETAAGDTHLTVSVTDTGLGIPADKLSLVFDKFAQVDASSTRRHEGTGLGLAITSSLVAMMGGEIGVESVEGEGSTFRFTLDLPLADDQKKPKPLPLDVSGARVLVVDDNPVNRSILREQMQSWGFDSCAAESGAEGLAVLAAAVRLGVEVDCVVLDYQMPGMTGVEMAERMRADPDMDVPVVMLTSVDQSLTVARGTELGISAHLIKPARSSALLEAVVAAIQKRRSGAEPAEAAEPTPASRPALRAVPSQPSPASDHRVDILVAEDNEVNQLVFTQILSETGFSFEIVTNGLLAVEAQRSMNPRMILMDVSMPKLNGLEATGRIRERESATGGHVPIVGVTAHALKGDRERCMEAGMDDYLPKPISPRALQAKIEHWLGDPGERRLTGGLTA